MAVSPDKLTQEIKNFALKEAGFDLVGVTSHRIPEAYEQNIKHWEDNGFAADLSYITKNLTARGRLDLTFPWARTVVVVAKNYYHAEDPKPSGIPTGKVAKYAYGKDYHKIIRQKLKQLSQFIQNADPLAKIKAYVDTGPLFEKTYAQQAGIGFFGKNTTIITQRYGSWVFLGTIITNLNLSSDEPSNSLCGSCRACIDSCPTQALTENGQMNVGRCLSYLNIESKEPIPETLKSKLGDRFFGCDLCQDACPYNRNPIITDETEFFHEKIAGTWIDLDEIKALKDERDFSDRFNESPLARTTLKKSIEISRIISRNSSIE